MDAEASNVFLAAQSSSRSLVVRSLVGRSVRHVWEKVTFRVSNGLYTQVQPGSCMV